MIIGKHAQTGKFSSIRILLSVLAPLAALLAFELLLQPLYHARIDRLALDESRFLRTEWYLLQTLKRETDAQLREKDREIAELRRRFADIASSASDQSELDELREQIRLAEEERQGIIDRRISAAPAEPDVQRGPQPRTGDAPENDTANASQTIGRDNAASTAVATTGIADSRVSRAVQEIAAFLSSQSQNPELYQHLKSQLETLSSAIATQEAQLTAREASLQNLEDDLSVYRRVLFSLESRISLLASDVLLAREAGESEEAPLTGNSGTAPSPEPAAGDQNLARDIDDAALAESVGTSSGLLTVVSSSLELQRLAHEEHERALRELDELISEYAILLDYVLSSLMTQNTGSPDARVQELRLLDNEAAQIADSLSGIRENERRLRSEADNLESRLRDLEAGIALAASRMQELAAGLEDPLTPGIASLNSLSIIRAIISADDIRQRYPNLRSGFEQYLRELEAFSRAEGRREGVDEMYSLFLDSLGDGSRTP